MPFTLDPAERSLATLMGRPCGKEVALRLHPAGRMAKRANSPAESNSSAAPSQAGTGHVSESVLETPLLPPLWKSRPS